MKCPPLCDTVRKTGALWLHGETRVNLDTGASLRRFVKLETVIGRRSPADARRKQHHVLSALGLTEATPIPGSYSNLTLEDGAGRRGQTGLMRRASAS